MSEETTTTTGTRISDLLERTSKLNENGAHYFVGWLISAGLQRPEVMADLERVLHEFENDPHLRHCFENEAAVGDVVRAGAESLPPLDKKPQDAGCEACPIPVVKLPATELGGSVPTSELTPKRRSLIPARIFGVLFGKPRIAA